MEILFRFFRHFQKKHPKFVYLKSILGFEPRNFDLYLVALTHASYFSDKHDANGYKHLTNERLEFLGDSVLDLAVGEFLYLKYPTEGEGFLTKTRSKIVNRESLNRLALQLGLDKLLESKGEIGKTALGNSLEALIGAIFLDQGWENAKKFVITKLLNQLIDIEELVSQETDFKSIAIEKCQKEKKKIKFDTKPVQNNKIDTFESNLLIDGKSVSKGTGKSKKEAEQVAAKEWLTSMNQKSKS